MIEQGRDQALSWVRGVSMFMIILCHITQYYELKIAWWLNVGVQIFFILSGYLYANRVITDRIKFFGKRLRKILIDYWVFTIPVLTLYWFFAPQKINVASMFDVLLFHGTIEGLGHLWFIPYILLCYALTPLLHDVFSYVESRNGSDYGLSVLLIFSVTHLVFTMFAPYFNPAWINAYIFGIAFGRAEKQQFLTAKVVGVLMAVLTFVFLSIQFLARPVFMAGTENLWGRLYQIWKDYGHVFLGGLIFVCLCGIMKNSHLNGGGIRKSTLLLTDIHMMSI